MYLFCMRVYGLHVLPIFSEVLSVFFREIYLSILELFVLKSSGLFRLLGFL